MTILANYKMIGGIHPETAALKNALAHAGVVAPHTGKPFSEAMILGIGGGLGIGYILWEFKAHNLKILVIAFRKDWQYPVRFMQAVCERLNVACSVLETTGKGTAAKQLHDALERGIAPIAWVDRAHMPYLQLREDLKGHMTHIVVVYGVDGENVLVDDLSAQPFTVPAEIFADGRNRIVSVKNRLLLVHADPLKPIDLPAAIMGGIQDAIEHLGGASDSFSLPAIRKWARLITDDKNAKGWRKVFADRIGLFSNLYSINEGIELSGTGGGAMRGLYADFLTEAAPIVNKPALNDAAERYRSLARQWSDLADTALPDDVPALRETKLLLRQKYDAMAAKGASALAELQPVSARLAALEMENNVAFPADDARVEALFETLGKKLTTIYEAEVKALDTLRAAVA